MSSWGPITFHPFGLIGLNPQGSEIKFADVSASNSQKKPGIQKPQSQPAEGDIDLRRLQPNRIQIKNGSSCLNANLILGIITLALIIINIVGILGTSSNVIAGINIALGVIFACVVRYKESQEKSSNCVRFLTVAFLIASFVLNVLVVAKVFDIGVFPGKIGGAELFLLALAGGSLLVNHLVNRSKK